MSRTATSAGRGRGPAAVLTGLSAWLPPRRVPNSELSARLDTSDRWIRERIGIAERRFAAPEVSTGDMAVEAAARALASAGADRVDALLLATSTPDHPCPATAPWVADRLGLASTAAFDVAAGCSGFLYAAAVADGLIASGTARRVLVVGAEAMTSLVDPGDRATAPIFGEGAGAAVFEAGSPSEEGALGPVSWGSDGSLADAIAVPAGGARDRHLRDRAEPGAFFVRMRGGEVFRHAVRRMTAAAQEAAQAAGWAMADVDRLVAHQANARITAAVADALGIPGERCPSNIREVGNTAAASLPLLLAHAADRGELKPGHKVLLTAFGSGLAWAATTLTWPAGLAARL
ncbi:beta-ketoacyl-ACP synthase 3 [Streptomyces rubrolavendulae]|uniref:Beta-ketoacyl-[acyl-carrier-protein] synthase III n=1 Tax=Streptomyces rubrolavendulae TaxID=285473 RepID=A0A1D8GB05_9ACTN|nr:beta-ketoacyl-ACP synthase 3 [Streptomyces rubrolavendulae]AOT62603.1 3-oxoacyl-[acyl-carrier-protein] synthase 3 [Streptomyces rubrolavendulae]